MTWLGPVRRPKFLEGRHPANSATANPPTHWSATTNVAWKRDLPGRGWSSPIVWGQRIFLTTCVSTGAEREARKGLYMQDLNADRYPRETNVHLYKVYCLDLSNGKVLWERVAHQGIPAKPHHIKNSLASETPATDGERVYALFGNLWHVLLRRGRQAAVEVRDSSTQHAIRLGDRDVPDSAWRPCLYRQRQRRRLVAGRAR